MATRTAFIATLALVLFILTGCATTFKAVYDHDPEQDFSTYKTFSWIEQHPMKLSSANRIPNPLLEPRIMTAVESALTNKGYSLVDDSGSADFVLAFTVGSREEIKIDTYPSMSVGYGRAGRWGGAYYGSYYGGYTETTVREYTTGTLAIDVFDVKDRQPVWHGVASKTISESDRENLEATVRAAVDAILAGFPPE